MSEQLISMLAGAAVAFVGIIVGWLIKEIFK